MADAADVHWVLLVTGSAGLGSGAEPSPWPLPDESAEGEIHGIAEAAEGRCLVGQGL